MELGTYYNDYGEIRFAPPMYSQRYYKASNFLQKLRETHSIGKVCKIVDFGCSELNFAKYLTTITGIRHLVAVDIDRKLLEEHTSRAEPNSSDIFNPKKASFIIDICVGSISFPDIRLKNADVVFAIEIIEHLYPSTLDAVPHNIFGYMQPREVFITTPNCEFNVFFKNFKGFRHDDHKFEWSREQFNDWCHNICVRYPNYNVQIFGIGESPNGDNCCCTQGAIFTRKELVHSDDSEMSYGVCSYESLLRKVDCEYELLKKITYPHEVDKRPLVVQVNEILKKACRVRLCSIFSSNQFIEVPLTEVFNEIADVCSMAELRRVLKEQWEVKPHPDYRGELIEVVFVDVEKIGLFAERKTTDKQQKRYRK